MNSYIVVALNMSIHKAYSMYYLLQKGLILRVHACVCAVLIFSSRPVNTFATCQLPVPLQTPLILLKAPSLLVVDRLSVQTLPGSLTGSRTGIFS